MTKTKTGTLQKVDAAYQAFSGLMEGAMAGKSVAKLDSGLLDLYVDLSGASDRDGLEASTSGNRAAFMESVFQFQGGMKKQEGLPRALQNLGGLVTEFEESVKSLHTGFLSPNLVSRIADETGVKPAKELVEAGKHTGYHEAIKRILQDRDARKEYGLAA